MIVLRPDTLMFLLLTVKMEAVMIIRTSRTPNTTPTTVAVLI